MSNVFFRRGQATQIELSGLKSPVFSFSYDTNYYQDSLKNPELVSFNRDFQSTGLRANIENILPANRTTLWDFWNTSLAKGEYEFSIIDHRKQVLFDCYWDSWKTRYKPTRGDIGDVIAEIKSPHQVLPPLFAWYDMTDNNINDYCLDSNSNLTLVDGTLVLVGTDAAVLSDKAYAMKITDPGTAQTGASKTNLTWHRQKDDYSISLLCQCYISPMNTSKTLNLVKLVNGDDYMRIYAGNDGVDDIIGIQWSNDATGSGYLSWAVTASTWYDVCLSYHYKMNRMDGFIWPSATTASWSTTDTFLDSETLTPAKWLVDLDPTYVPIPPHWTELYLLTGEQGSLFSSGSKALLQYPMIFDSYISPYMFNYIRRLWHKFNFTWKAL